MFAKGKYLVSDGRGVVYSYVVHHHPQVPGRQTPFVVALVELDEGVRILGELDGEPSVGLPVEVVFTKVDDELTMPSWTPRAATKYRTPSSRGLPSTYAR